MATSNGLRLAIALSIVTAGAALAVPAGAQTIDARAAFDQRPHAELVQWREFFPFTFLDRRRPYNPESPWGPPRPQIFESTKPPAPRKVETPPTETVLVIGDSFTRALLEPMLLEHVGRVVWLYHQHCGFDWGAIDRFRPDEVWWMPTERFLACDPDARPCGFTG